MRCHVTFAEPIRIRYNDRSMRLLACTATDAEAIDEEDCEPRTRLTVSEVVMHQDDLPGGQTALISWEGMIETLVSNVLSTADADSEGDSA